MTDRDVEEENGGNFCFERQEFFCFQEVSRRYEIRHLSISLIIVIKKAAVLQETDGA